MIGKRGAGPLDILVSGAIIILIAVITVSIAISVNENIKDSQLGPAKAVLNENLISPGTAVNLSYGVPTNLVNTVDVIPSSAQLAMFNVTIADNVIINQANYTLNSGGTLNLTDETYDNKTAWINYSYYEHGADYNASAKGTTGLGAFSDYWVSIVSILILVVIVGLFSYFKGGSGGVDIR